MLATHKGPIVATMESSRLFVKNLPPNITEAEFRKHFSAQGREVTDVKLIPNRRIGFVGYRSHEDAARAVKYFHRSFIRMSRIAVDVAKPVRPAGLSPHLLQQTLTRSRKIADQSNKPTGKPLARHDSRGAAAGKDLPTADAKEEPSPKKRKRDELDEADPKLQEFLEVMGHPSKRAKDQGLSNGLVSDTVPVVTPVIEAGESDDEYEDIPVRSSKPIPPAPPETSGLIDPMIGIQSEPSALAPDNTEAKPEVAGAATDDDWLRSRTNRLLDLVDPDDPGFSARPAASVSAAEVAPSQTRQESQPTDDVPAAPETETVSRKGTKSSDPLELLEKTSRLFLRNLSYNITEDDIREHFSPYGALQEVRQPAFFPTFQPFMMNP